MYQALWVPRANSTTGSKAVAIKVMTRVAAAALGMKYYDELKRSHSDNNYISLYLNNAVAL